ncbi:MAG: hypothetical protein IKO55_05470 [Kiritimatiellae bacterium]|nr:hypothetical protein [Kiritimatiellia bacterium]
MARWFDEVRLSSHPIEEIGAAFYVREILKNDCLINKWDLRDVFGPRYESILENLRRSDMLKMETVGSLLSLSIVAPGDRKRERCRRIGQSNRAIIKFEESVIVGKRKPDTKGKTS